PMPSRLIVKQCTRSRWSIVVLLGSGRCHPAVGTRRPDRTVRPEESCPAGVRSARTAPTTGCRHRGRHRTRRTTVQYLILMQVDPTVLSELTDAQQKHLEQGH